MITKCCEIYSIFSMSIDRFDQLMEVTRLRKASKKHILFFKGEIDIDYLVM